MKKMHDYKGFCVEPIIGGWNIVLYGRKHTLYVAGPTGFRLTEDLKEARAFRDPMFCYQIIDEVISDHSGWINSLGGKSPIDISDNQQQKSQDKLEKVLQQHQQNLL